MKKLDVHHVVQKISNDCMASCLKMVMDYHGAVVDYDEMVKTFSFYSVGLSLPQIGIYALENGFKVEIDTLNPHLFNIKDTDKSQNEIKEKLKNLIFKNEQFSMVRDYFIEFMDAGGKLNPHLPVKQDIINEIDAGRPVIIMVVSRLLHGHGDGYNFHGNVVYGYDDENFFIMDPHEAGSFGGGPHIINQDLVMYAFAVMAYADPDNASIFKISK